MIDKIAELEAIICEQKSTIFQLKSIIDNIPGDVYWKNKQSIYLGLNLKGSESIKKMGFHWNTRDIIGKTDYDIYDKETAGAYIANDLQVIESGLESTVEETVHMASGDKMTQLSIKRPLLDEEGRIVGIVGNTIDITYLKKIEAKLILAKEAADAASLAKTIFLANMSHDLKTPLTGIISTAEHLSESLNDLVARNQANDIVQSGLRLLELLVEIIELSRLDLNAKPRHATFELQTLVNDLVQLLKPVIANKNLQFEVHYQNSIPHQLIGDRWQLYRIILNLLTNAIKFTPKGSISLRLMIEHVQANELLLKIIVKDTGIGIPLEKHGVIFEEFTRLTDSFDEAYKGTGLGLFIVKKFVEAMNGRIQVESIENEGSIFTCCIPFNAENSAITLTQSDTFTDTILSAKQQPTSMLTPSATEPTDLLAAKHILLIEDNVIVARATKAMLEALGCSVAIASTGFQALALFEQNHYDFVYSDLGLPDMSGFDVCQKMRAMEANPNIPIVALSAHVDEDIRARCLSVGMNEALNKPLLREHAKQNILSYFSK